MSGKSLKTFYSEYITFTINLIITELKQLLCREPYYRYSVWL